MAGIDTDSDEFKFIRDLMNYIMGIRMQGLNYVPTGVFVVEDPLEDLDHPFAHEIKNYVKQKMDRYDKKYHERFDKYFHRGSVTKEVYTDMCRTMKIEFLERKFSIRYFLEFCIKLSYYAALSYLYRIEDGPLDTVRTIINAIQSLKANGTVDDSLWEKVKDWTIMMPEWTETESEDSERTDSVSSASSTSDYENIP